MEFGVPCHLIGLIQSEGLHLRSSRHLRHECIVLLSWGRYNLVSRL